METAALHRNGRISGTVPVTRRRSSPRPSGHYRRRRRAPHDHHRTFRALAANERQHFPDEPLDAIHVWQPVHGSHEHQVDGLVRRRFGRREAFDIHAGGNGGHPRQAEKLPHGASVLLRNRHHAGGRAAGLPLEPEHAVGLQPEIPPPRGSGGMLRVPPPDHGFHVVLEEHAVLQVREIGCRIRNRLPRDRTAPVRSDCSQKRAQRGSVVPPDGQRHRVEQPLRQIERKPRRALVPNAMLEWIRPRAVLLGARPAPPDGADPRSLRSESHAAGAVGAAFRASGSCPPLVVGCRKLVLTQRIFIRRRGRRRAKAVRPIAPRVCR